MTDMPKPATGLNVDFGSFIGPLFFVWLVQLPLPWVRPAGVCCSSAGATVSAAGLTVGAMQAVVQLVHEKQHRLRSMMRMHGLSNSAYVLCMYIFFILQYMVYIAFMMVAGLAAQLNIFRVNSVGA